MKTGNPRDDGVSFPYELKSNQGRGEIIDAGCIEAFHVEILYRGYRRIIVRATSYAVLAFPPGM
jgi:hypothetical protein